MIKHPTASHSSIPSAAEKRKLPVETPDLSILRKGLFWDTNIDRINWQKQAGAVIRRVFERGDEAEKKEIIRFYGPNKVKSIIGKKPSERISLNIFGTSN